ncbi:hypothetical protein CHS0354_034756, partial [Potamilus streckersoni]
RREKHTFEPDTSTTNGNYSGKTAQTTPSYINYNTTSPDTHRVSYSTTADTTPSPTDYEQEKHYSKTVLVNISRTSAIRPPPAPTAWNVRPYNTSLMTAPTTICRD